MKIYITLFAFALLLFTACSDDDNPTNTDEGQTIKTQQVQIGNGNAYSWLKVDANDIPEEFGIFIHEDAVTGLPDDITDFHLAVPTVNGNNVLGIQSVHMDWNPQGHPPMSIYTIPHFDLHFYVIPENVVNNIGPTTTAPVDPTYVAQDYIIIDTAYVPMMGAHAVDTLAPELRGSTFDQTYIYGYYDGKLAFYEPMFTVDYLNTQPNETFTIKSPQAFTYNGYAPGKLTYSYNATDNGWYITMSELTAVTAQ